jgi:hypothetical protein
VHEDLTRVQDELLAPIGDPLEIVIGEVTKDLNPPEFVEVNHREGGVETVLDVDFHLVDIAPPPRLAGFDRPHDRVVLIVEVLGGVLVLGAIAAPNVAARPTHPEVHPRVAHLETLFTAACARLHIVDLIQMCTFERRHRWVPSLTAVSTA